MPRPGFSAHRDAQRRGDSVYCSASNNNNGARSSPGSAAAASLNAWVHTHLLDTTAQLLTAQPADPLRVLSVRFSTEAVLAATYPATSSPVGEKELEAEAVEEASGVIGAAPASGAAKSSVFNTNSAKPKPPILIDGCTPSVPAVEHLIEHSWVRRRLQPYGLYAVARCMCSCPPLRLPSAVPSRFGVRTSLASSAGERDTATAETAYATARPLLSQWMDIFALLHRQSRMSFAELAAEATHWDAHSKSAAVVPPVDYRAAEEIPTSEVLLYVMAVVEEHLRRAECGGAASGAARPPRLSRRLQMSVKLLALQLLAAFVDLQHSAESTQCGSGNVSAGAFDQEQEHDVNESSYDGRETTTEDLEVYHITRDVHLLSVHQLDELHQWLHCCLRKMITSPDSPLTTSPTAIDGSNACGGWSSEAVDFAAGSPLDSLQSRATAYLTRALRSSARDMAAPASAPAVMSLDTFVAFMERLAAVVVAHQQTAVAMGIALSARLPPRSTASTGKAQLRAWVMEHVGKCADAVVQQQFDLRDDTMPDPISAVPLAWRAYVNQISDLLAPFQRDVLARLSREQRDGEKHRGTLDDRLLSKLQRRLLSWAKEAEYRHAKAEKRPTEEDSSPGVLAAEVVSAWVSHVFEAYAVTLYPS